MQNDIDEKIFSSFLGLREMRFMKDKVSIQREISNLQNNNFKSKSRTYVKQELFKLSNQLIVLEENYVNKLRNDRSL